MRFLLAILPLLSPLAHGQMNKAEATLHVRTVEGHLEAAVEIEIDRGWHLYHKDLGDDPNAIGKPTKVKFLLDGEETDEILWTEVWFPEPHVGVQKGLGEGGGDANILEHKGTIILYAAGSFEEAIELDTLTVEINGLTCVESGMCVPYKEEVEVDGEGSAAIWEAWPSELLEEGAAQSGIVSSGNTTAELFVRHSVGETRAVLVIDVERDWHIYHEDIGDGHGIGRPTSIDFAGNNLTWGGLHWPKPHVLTQEALGPKDPETGEYTDAWILSHEGKIVIRTSALVADGEAPGEVKVTVVGQACETGGMCVDVEYELKSNGEGPDEYFDASFPPYVSKDARAVALSFHEAEKEELSLWQFLVFAFGAGLLTLLMPCTYPMIPITISFFTKQAEARDGKVLPLSAAYGAGIVLIFVLIGVIIGPFIIAFAVHWATNLLIGGMFVFFALSLFGFYEIQPPKFMLNAAGKATMRGGYVGVFLMGATLVVTSFTCTAPFVGTLLSVGASTGGTDLVRVALGMGVFGLTMAIPFVLLSLLPGKVKQMPKSGMWMKTLKVTLGFVELAAALKFLSNVDLALGWYIFPKEIFLGLWIVIFLTASIYLMGLFTKTKGITVGRRLVSIMFLALAAYWTAGLFGAVEFDKNTVAFIPPYGFAGETTHDALVKDDYLAALARAKEEKKLVLVNFTGFT